MPALQRYKLAGEAEQYSIDIARGGYYPSVVLNAGVGTSNTSGSGNLGTQLKDRLNEQISVTVSVLSSTRKRKRTRRRLRKHGLPNSMPTSTIKRP